MRILVTGHKGYIGSHLYKRLRIQGHTVYGFDLKDQQDVVTSPIEYEVDVVVHLAGKSGVRESVKSPSAYWFNNVEGSKRIFNLFKNTRILYASSSSAYEPDLNPYAASKYITEISAQNHPNSLGMRFHTVYSDKPRKDMFLDKLINGKLTYVTDHSRDFIHIEDLCDAIELLLKTDLTGVIDVGSGISTEVQDIAPALPIRTSTPYERKHTQADIKKLQELGYRPKYSIQDFLTSQDLGITIRQQMEKNK